MKIAYYASGWPINIGNGFIDYGAVHLIKTAAPNAQVYWASELAKWVFKANRQNMDHSIDLAELMDIDYLVVSGMSLCDEFIEVEGPVLKKLSERGVKIVFNGSGGESYHQKEVDNFKKFMASIQVTAFISRDEVSYNNFKDLCPVSFNGIDCGFFLSDAFRAAPLIIKDYVVYAFDWMDEPLLDTQGRKVMRAHHDCSKVLPNYASKSLRKNGTVFTLNNKWPFIRKVGFDDGFYFKNRDILISDIPDDYLHLYANCYAVYTDRVHAAIAGLSFGHYARLYSKSPRGYLFERMGVGDVKSKLVKLDQGYFNKEKQDHISFLKKVFAEKTEASVR